MTTGEKIARLRREQNITQENLADALGVSRQAVSKWEADLAFPETEKLIRLCDLFGCSTDYLLKNNVDEKGKKNSFSYEYRSKRTIGGLPILHINWGSKKTARGIIAIGIKAQGIFSVGLLSIGVFSLGLLSLGFFSLGVLAIGLMIGAGAFGMGFLGFGAIAFGIVSFGAVSIGQFSFGAVAVGNYFATGAHATGHVAIGSEYASGDLYEFYGRIADSDLASIEESLNSIVPKFLRWIVRIIVGVFS